MLPWFLVAIMAIVHLFYLLIARPTFKNLKSSFLTGSLILMFLVHMKVSYKMFEIMDCRTVEGKDYLVADL